MSNPKFKVGDRVRKTKICPPAQLRSDTGTVIRVTLRSGNPVVWVDKYARSSSSPWDKDFWEVIERD